ncbi:MAG: polysaccharide biosynthesis C-terminal domain-containing protein [Clostridiales bacterium]|nr:polysaccharide biosynthesis C-terminal domain-containing protein [Clostridiales bacterium]
MKIGLSEHFTLKKILRFTLPSVIMMIFTSVYGVVDGFFVSNFVGKTPFTAVNFIMPFLMLLGSAGFMFGTGGCALIAKTMGEGNLIKAKRLFSMFVYVSIAAGVIIAVLGFIFLRPCAVILGAEGEMLENCIIYGRINLIAIPVYILQFEFQSFFVAAEKPQLGLSVTIAAGVTNMVLDLLLVAVFPLGLRGAAAATALSQCVGGVIPLIYFSRRNSSRLRLTKTSLDLRALLKCCTNGSSELLTNISLSVVNMLYNAQLIKYVGNDGVAAYGVIMYVNLIFLSAFIGYSSGAAPVFSYNYGAQNNKELKSLLINSVGIISVFAVLMFVFAEISGKPLALIFVSYDKDLLDLTVKAFKIYSFSFLFAGVGIFGSSFFTALNNGLVSASISFLRTFLYQAVAVLVFPLILGINGIWISIVAAEFAAALTAILFIAALRKKYDY